MVDEIRDGGPAFAYGSHEQGGHSGMRLRDWFAGQALSSIGTVEGYADHAGLAADCYAVADAMLAARTPDTEG